MAKHQARTAAAVVPDRVASIDTLRDRLRDIGEDALGLGFNLTAHLVETAALALEDEQRDADGRRGPFHGSVN